MKYEIVVTVTKQYKTTVDASGYFEARQAAYCYLRVCDQLPPGMSRVRKFWNAITTVMLPAREAA